MYVPVVREETTSVNEVMVSPRVLSSVIPADSIFPVSFEDKDMSLSNLIEAIRIRLI